MQLSARILTALAVLAFTVAIVAGARSATEDVSAATGTIDAMNVGACTTTNADVLAISDCKNLDVDGNGTVDNADGNTKAFFDLQELEQAIEVDELYATYAHDPKTGAEAPRGIITNGDLIKISIKDTGRDRRDPVLIAIDVETSIVNGTPAGANSDAVFTIATPPTLISDYTNIEGATDGGSEKIVADSVGVKPAELSDLGLQTPHFGQAPAQGIANFVTSGSYTIIFQGSDTANPFLPIAPKGVVKFFGRIDDGKDNTTDGDKINGLGPFKDIGGNVKLDEDVISGENGTPAMVLNISVPSGTTPSIQLQVIYYETSAVENLDGGEPYCSGSAGVGSDGDCPTKQTASNDSTNVLYTSDEKKNNTPLLVQATSDGNDADADLYLMETGRFDGIYEGYVRLTDADGDGSGDGTDRDNWGETDVGDVGDATGATVANAATLGVGNGPVIINYRDSDGKNRSFEIQIDIDPPVITIDSPVHMSRSDDEKPSFVGTINDGDSGLAADTFQLFVDNEGDKDDDNSVLSIAAGYVTSGGQVQRRLDYTGFDTTAQYGVVGPGEWEAEESDAAGAAYKSLEADEYDDGAPDGEFSDEIEIDFDEGDTDFKGFNHAVDFQALVRDRAGNVGFSDSDPAKPRFINALGEEEPDDRDLDGKKHNVLGVFSRHVVYLDEVDPYIQANRSTTGFYGLDDGKPIRDSWSVMVVFDGKVNGSLIDAGTFTLEYDDESAIGIADVLVKDQLVFLKLDEELASDARPTLSITEGREVEDLAGNILGSAEHLGDPDNDDPKVSSIKVRDGILPVFTLTLSGGSGTGSGGEGSAKLTKEEIDIAIESDEDINGAPKVSVVCSNIGWKEDDPDAADETISRDLDDYVSNRTGYDDDTMAETSATTALNCGGADNPNDFIESSSLSRPGNNWVYAWRNPASDASKLPDGGLTVVVWGRDRGGFEYYKDGASRDNYGSRSTAFTLDTTFNSPLSGSGGEVQPEANSDVAEPRPFVLLDFAGERTNVAVTKLTVDETDVLGSLDNIGENRFLYWPEALAYGKHTVVFDARDAADNKPVGATKFSFEVTARDPFVLDITAGWNAISFPADPVDTALSSVFTEASIDRVVGWNPMSGTGPWSIASRIDGVWTTSADFAPLTDVTARYGYWLHSTSFVKQSVDLVGPINRETGGMPVARGIPTIAGWNFVGVVDQDGDQTEDHYGKDLKDSEQDVVTAKNYMPDYARAYTWDAIGNGYRVLEEDAPVVIGKGIWVYFGKAGIAP